MRISTFVSGSFSENCYVVQDEGTGKAVVIDPGEYSQELAEQIERIGRENITAILLTHCHFDHILGVAEVRELCGAPVMIHEQDADSLTDPARNGVMFFGLHFASSLVPADKTLREGDAVEAGDLSIKVIHTPGHTPGSCCFAVDGTLFSGDTLFPEACGRTDLPGGSRREMCTSLKRLAALEGDYRVFAGHGEPTTLEWERKHNPYITGTV